jgi:nucleotide-binding universal stress UspA family protein
MYEKILVPLDGSKLAEQVIPYVSELSKAFKSEVTLIGICEPEEIEYGEACRLYMAGRADVLRKSIGDDAEGKVLVTIFSGRAAGEILKYAEENGINLIVMTSHGRSGIVPWSLGGTVNKVLQKVGVPLLVIRVQEQPAPAVKPDLFGRIVVPLDGSANGAAVLPFVAEIARKLESDVYLLQVVEAGKHVHTIGGLDYIPFKDQDMNERKDKALEYLEGVTSGLEGVTNVYYEVRCGEAAKEIIQIADEKEVNLIAVSSHGHSAIAVWTHGSVTYKVLQASKQSIFFVPSPEIKHE